MENDWDRRFEGEDYLFGTEPNAFLASQAFRLEPGMKALAVADGEGRNGVWLAERGLDVVSIDASTVGLAKARELARRRGVTLETVLADLAEWEWEPEAYDLVVAIFVQFAPPELRRIMFEGFHTCLRPGGLLIMQGYRVEQLGYGTGGPPHADHLYTQDLLIRSFGHWEIRHLRAHDSAIEEGVGHSGMSALIDLVAEKARHDALPLPAIGAEHAELRVAAQASARPGADIAEAHP
ncbi:SAM-dependent methyltransferase [Shinella granuli]|jgi:SAM-dependent methyltransferase|uniref:Methyltransferase family protein n=2 Tax=Shinella granuli TaxID=323621 RepID=A0A4R2CAU8_SHIGR|nr:MAG: SAM-dependent methyltransferase [Bradyrhizobiaceae bacterium PARB1]TCN35949.1 methyltransferase family protein [Shinella granuli]